MITQFRSIINELTYGLSEESKNIALKMLCQAEIDLVYFRRNIHIQGIRYELLLEGYDQFLNMKEEALNLLSTCIDNNCYEEKKEIWSRLLIVLDETIRYFEGKLSKYSGH